MAQHGDVDARARAASQIVVPSGTGHAQAVDGEGQLLAPRPGGAAGAGLEAGALCTGRLQGWAARRSVFTAWKRAGKNSPRTRWERPGSARATRSASRGGEPEGGDQGGGHRAVRGPAPGPVVGADHAVRPSRVRRISLPSAVRRAAPRGCAAGSVSSARVQPSRTLKSFLRRHDAAAVVLSSSAVDVPAGDRGEQLGRLGVRGRSNTPRRNLQRTRLSRSAARSSLRAASAPLPSSAVACGPCGRRGRPRTRWTGCGRRHAPRPRSPTAMVCSARGS